MLPRSVHVGYGVGSFATGAFGTVPGLLLLYYLTDTLAVPAGLAAVIVFLPKAWDVLLNPYVGRTPPSRAPGRPCRWPPPGRCCTGSATTGTWSWPGAPRRPPWPWSRAYGRSTACGVLGTPDAGLLAVAAADERVDVLVVADEMRARGWYLQPHESVAGLAPRWTRRPCPRRRWTRCSPSPGWACHR